MAATDLKWNDQQNNALMGVDYWFRNETSTKPIYRVFGFAGTGKSTLARHFADNIDGDVLYAAFTGKAASVMRKAGCFGASTIHSLIYKAKERITETGAKIIVFELNTESELRDAALLIVDECSMVDERIGKDLLSFGTPILVLGDPAQLPPPSGAGFFTNADPDHMLTEIHRQAQDNPIIYLSHHVREGNKLKHGTYGDSRIIKKAKRSDGLGASQIIVGRNVTRTKMNSTMRRLHGRDKGVLPVVGDKLICLKNDSSLGIYNGGIFFVDEINKTRSGAKSKYMVMRVTDEDGIFTVEVNAQKSIFSGEKIPFGSVGNKNGQQFDYGYAITCHKSQGSQWENVLIYDESWCFRDEWSRWLYTAITRASEKFTIVAD